MRDDVEALRDQLLHAVGEAIIAVDLEGRVTTWNPAAERLYGWRADEAHGRLLRDLIVPDQGIEQATAVRAQLLSGESWSGRFVVRRRDGSTFPAHVTDTPIIDASGQVVGLVGVSFDLSEREAASRQLQRLAAVVDAIADAVVTVRMPDGVVEDVNVAGLRLLRRDRVATLGGSLATVLPLDAVAEGELLRSVLAGRVWQGRLVAETVAEVPRHWDVTATAVREDDGRVVQAVVMVRDVTAQVVPEDQLRRSEARFRALVQRSADAALLVDGQGVLMYASPALREVFGFEPWEVEGQSGFQFVHPDDLDRAAALLADVMAAPGPQPPIELRLRTADGRFIWAEESVSNQLHNPEVGGIVVNLRDISVRKASEEALAASERRYRAIVDAAEEGIWLLDQHDVTTFVNRRLEQMLAVEPGGLLGRSPLEFVHPEDAGMLAAAIAEQHSSEVRSTLECRFVSRPGPIIDVLIARHSFFDADGRYRGTQGLFTDITGLKQAQRELARAAVRDPLTGLANRTLLTEQLGTIMDSQSRVPSLAAALCVDLDGDFAKVTDAFGHEAGDRLLLEVADRLAGAARPGDIVARFNAREFLVLCADLDDIAEAHQIARRMQAAVAEPMEFGSGSTSVAAAIGIAHTPAASPTELLRNAEAAAHRAARQTPNGVATFCPNLHDDLRTEFALLEALREALAVPGQFRLEYQPIMALPKQRPVGVEALLRWQHPTRGRLMPDVFIPLAEREGLIPALDRWVIHEAITILAAWRADGVVDEQFRVAINVSGSHYTDASLVDDVRVALASSGLPPSSLVLEVTETAVVTDLDDAIGVLQELKDLGVGLAIDDFGTGYSSLAYLRRFPVDTLKIDRSFVSGVAYDNDDHAIVASTLSLAQSVGMTCVAEGVETPEQLQVLLELGCVEAQGYLWSPAVPAQELPAVLAFPFSTSGPVPRRASPVPQPTPSTHDPDIQRQILELHHTGASLQTIAAALNRNGNRTGSGKRWHGATVARVVATAMAASSPPVAVTVGGGRRAP